MSSVLRAVAPRGVAAKDSAPRERRHGIATFALGPPLAGTVAAQEARIARAREARIGLQTETSSMDPHFALVGANQTIARHIFGTLLGADEARRPAPGLTSARAVAPDTWEFTIRAGAVLHDGTPTTGEDIRFSPERMPRVPNSPAAFIRLAGVTAANVFFNRAGRREFSAFLIGFGSTAGDAYPALSLVPQRFDQQRGLGGLNRGRYGNPGFDALLARSNAATDAAERDGLLRKAAIWFASDAPDADLHRKLLDVAPPTPDDPRGFATNLGHGALRPRYRDDPARPAPLPRGRPIRVVMQLFPTAKLFRTGHRIRLDVAASNFPQFDLNAPSFEPDERGFAPRVAVHRVFCDAARDSRLSLPLAPV